MSNPLDDMPDFPPHVLKAPCCDHLWDVQTDSVPESGVPMRSTVTCRHCGKSGRLDLVFQFHKA